MPRIRRVELIVLPILALASVLAAWALVSWVPTGLVGRYWDNDAWTGRPIAESTGSVPMAADILRHVPQAATGAGSAEWTGFLLIDESGRHTFEVIADDGAWLYIDDELVIDNGGIHPRTAVERHVDLSAGLHRVRVRYFQGGGELDLAFRWTRPNGRTGHVTRHDLAPDEGAAGRQPHPLLRRVLPVAVPVIWGCLFLYLPVRVIGWWMWREVARVTPRVEDRRSLLLILGVAAGLLVWGIQWGGQYGDRWAADELTPVLVRDALQRGFSGGWHDKYPLLHYVVMAIPVSAFELANRLGILAVDLLVSHATQLAMMRAVSVLMGLGTLIAAFMCGAELWGSRRAIFAPMALLLTPQFVFYGKLANLDIPMMCWLGWALFAFLRICRTNRLADHVLLGVTAAGAVATKDQAYASLALLPIAVVAANARHQPSSTWWRRQGSAVMDSKIWIAGLSAAAASVAFHNVVFNFDGVVAHVTLLASFNDLAVVPRTLAGYMDLTWTTVTLFRFVTGWPLFMLAIVGVARAATHPDRRWWLWLLVVPLSFHLTFTVVTLYVNDRYLFGGVFVLALFAGSACADLLDARRWRRTARTVVAGAVAYSLLYAASINVMMQRDARWIAREWLQAHAPDDTLVGLVGDYLPYVGVPLRSIPITTTDDVQNRAPRFIILNARFVQRFASERQPDGRNLLRGLQDGTLGYTEVFRFRAAAPAWAFLWSEAPITGSAESPLTNLDKVNPEMAIYQRNPP